MHPRRLQYTYNTTTTFYHRELSAQSTYTDRLASPPLLPRREPDQRAKPRRSLPRARVRRRARPRQRPRGRERREDDAQLDVVREPARGTPAPRRERVRSRVPTAAAGAAAGAAVAAPHHRCRRGRCARAPRGSAHPSTRSRRRCRGGGAARRRGTRARSPRGCARARWEDRARRGTIAACTGAGVATTTTSTSVLLRAADDDDAPRRERFCSATAARARTRPARRASPHAREDCSRARRTRGTEC